MTTFGHQPKPPVPPTKKQLAHAVTLFTMKYRSAHGILPTVQLTHYQVEEIMDGICDLLYQYEELKPLSDDDEDYGTDNATI